MLEKGKLYRLPDGKIIECLEVNWSCAVVRPVRKTRTEFETRNGEHVRFDKYERTFVISHKSIIEEVEGR